MICSLKHGILTTAQTKGVFIVPERVMVIIDGDNIRDYLDSVRANVDSMVKFYIADREIGVQPAIWLSVRSFNPRLHYCDAFPARLTRECRLVKVETTLQVKRGPNPDDKTFKGYPDMLLFVHVMRNITKFDTLLIFVRDRDFNCIINYIRNDLSKRVEVYSPAAFSHLAIQREVDKYCDITQDYPWS